LNLLQIDLPSVLEGKKISLSGNLTVLRNEDQSEEGLVNGSGPETYETVASRQDEVNESLLMLLPQETSGFKIGDSFICTNANTKES